MSTSTLMDICPLLETRLKLFTQANVAIEYDDEPNTISTLDVIEMINIMKQEVFDQLISKEVTLNGENVVQYGGYKKYRKDKKFVAFWNDVQHNVRDQIENCFQREIFLSGQDQLKSHPMSKRFGIVIVIPVIEHLALFHPTNVISDGNQVFDWMVDFVSSVEVRTHSDDVLVARNAIIQMASVKKTVHKSRHRLIGAAVLKAQGLCLQPRYVAGGEACR